MSIITIPKIYLNFSTTLSAKISSSATSFTLSTGTDPDGTALSGTYLLTFDKGRSTEEDMLVTLVGSAGTIVTRGLSQVDAKTNVAANQYAHGLGNSVEITNATLLLIVRLLNGDESFNGVDLNGINSIAGVSGTYVAPVDDEDYVQKKYSDDTAAGGTISINRIVVAGTAGETLTAGQVIYLKPSDQRWWLADASVAATSENVDLGIAQGAGTAGNAISSGVLKLGMDTTVTGLTAGKVYLSDTAGEFSSTPGTIEVSLGIALTAISVDFFPRYDQVLTEDQQDALVGTSGTPSTTNKYATENDTSNRAEITGITISFTLSTKTIADSGDGFVTAEFRAGSSITVSGSASNDGTYTVVSVSAGSIVVLEALVDEVVGATVTIQTDIANKTARADSSGKIHEDFLQMTAADATSLTDGSDITTEHNHATQTANLLGSNSAGTHYTYQFEPGSSHFTLTNGAYLAGSYGLFQSSNISWQSITTVLPQNDDTDPTTARWNDSKDWTFEARIRASIGTVGDRTIGISEGGWTSTYNNTSNQRATFGMNGGVLYSVSYDGTGVETTDISSGITVTRFNTYKIEFTAGVDIKYYVNGTLKATHTTRVPAGDRGMYLGFGGQTNGEDIQIGPMLLRYEIN